MRFRGSGIGLGQCPKHGTIQSLFDALEMAEEAIESHLQALGIGHVDEGGNSRLLHGFGNRFVPVRVGSHATNDVSNCRQAQLCVGCVFHAHKLFKIFLPSITLGRKTGYGINNR